MSATVIDGLFPLRVVEDSGLTTHEVAMKAGLSFRQVDFLVRCGRVPDFDALADIGTGRPRRWTVEQAHFVMRLARLARAGIDLKAAAKALAAQTVDGVLPDRIDLGGGHRACA